MKKTANPALIIGLGGTGQWVLTYVKKNLLETYGKVPETVQLLAFDTTSEDSDASIEFDRREEQAQVGDVRLDSGEFVFLGGNIKHTCEEIMREDKHKHISSWLWAKYYLSTLDGDAFEIAKGAGRRRPFGRMAVFHDLMQGQPKILGKIDQALTNIRTASRRIRPIEIYVIASLAGGTGSGMFIDITQLVRDRAQRAQIPHAVRGFLVLQNTFAPVAQIRDVQPKAFAAMRELERFMLRFDRDYPMYYTDNPNKPELRTIYKNKLFDNCYLLDARRTNLPLDGIKPKLGVFPSVAESINVLLDPETGNTFDQHYKNINERLALAQAKLGKALYSSLGTYTYILPVDDIIERNTYKLALDLIKNRLVGLYHDEKIDLIKPVSNHVLEYQTLPRDEVKSFLRMEESQANVRNIAFCQNMTLALDQALDQTNVVQSMAERGAELLAWLEPVEQEESMVSAGNRIEEVLNTSLIVEVLTANVAGEGNDYVAASIRIIRQIREIRARMLGQEEIGGRRTRGKFELGLQEYAKFNSARFHRLLTEKLSLILNGTTKDQVVAKTGKLPYAQEFLQVLIRAFEDFENFLERVVKYRADEGSVAQARDYAQQTRQIMQDAVYANSMLDRLRKTALKAEEAYIENEDYLFDLEREDKLYQALLSMTRNFKDISEQAKQMVDSWIAILAVGGMPGSNETGIYKTVLTKQVELQRRRNEQKQIRVYEYLTDDAYENNLYEARISEKVLNDILHRFRWRFAEDKMMDLRLFYDDRDDESELLREAPNRNMTATGHNVNLLLSNLRPYFHDIRNETLADRMDEYLSPARAVKKMLDSSGALISYSGHQQGHLERHTMICVNKGVQINYFDALKNELKASAPNDQDNQVIGLSNQHRCTILSTLDLIVGQHINPYETSSRAYQEERGDRRLLHNFPAEVHASEVEKQLSLPPLNQVNRLFAPQLVALLENKNMMRRFVLAHAYGLICEESAPNTRGKQYILQLNTTSRHERRNTPHKITLTQTSSLFEAIKNFVLVHLDPLRGIQAIKDVTRGTNIFVKPEQVDEALNLREESIISNRETIVAAFTDFLQNGQLEQGYVRDVLADDGEWLFVNAFRTLLPNIEQMLKNDMNQVHDSIAELIQNNRDCYVNDYENELITAFLLFINDYAGNKVRFRKGNRLIIRLETYLDEIIQPMLISTDPLIKDVGSIIYLIVWNEVERLERLRDKDFYPLDAPPQALTQRDLAKLFLDRLRHWPQLSTNEFRASVSKAASQITSFLKAPDPQVTHFGNLSYFELTTLSEKTDSIPFKKVPIIFNKEDVSYASNDIESLRQLTGSYHVAILVTSASEQSNQKINEFISRVRSAYAIDVALLGEDEILQLFSSPIPKRTIRQLLLAGSDPEMVSPFTINDPVPDNVFFGRAQELRKITKMVCDDANSVSIVGGRRIGKTSILSRLHRVIFPQREFHSIFHDCTTTTNFDSFMSAKIRSWQPKKPNTSYKFIGDVLTSPPEDKPLVLILDEVGRLLINDKHNDWHLTGLLRGLSNENQVQTILGGANFLWEAKRDAGSPLFNFTQEVHIGSFGYTTVQELVTRLMKQVEVDLINPVEIIDRIYNFTSGHPNIVQRLCHRLVQHLAGKRNRVIIPDDINAIIRIPAFLRDDYLDTYWGAASSLEKLVTLVMIEDSGIHALGHIQETLEKKFGISPSAKSLTQAFNTLVNQRLILEETSHGYFFATKSFPDVIREGPLVAQERLALLVDEYQEGETW